MSYILRRLINVYFLRYCLPIIHGFVSINHVVIAGSKLGNIIELGICQKKKKLSVKFGPLSAEDLRSDVAPECS